MKNDNFLISLASSIALHLLVLLLCLVGLPFSFRPLSNDEQIITFEMLPVAEVSNIPTTRQNIEKIEEHEDAKKIQASKEPEVHQEIEETPKPQEIEKPKEKEAEAIPEKKKEEPKKEESKKTEPVKQQIKKPQEIKPKEKAKKKNNDDLESLLKNLEKSSKGNGSKTNKAESNKDGKENSKGTFNEDMPLSISEKALIKKQIETNWKIPIGAENIDQIKIIAYIALNIDGSVIEVKITEKNCNGVSSTVCNLFADSCVRAVWQSSPIQGLPQGRHTVWKEFNFLFDPADMVR